MKNSLTRLSQPLAWQKIAQAARHAPSFLLLQHVRLVEILVLTLVLVVGVLLVAVALFVPPPAPPATGGEQTVLSFDQIPMIESRLQQRQDERQRSLQLETRTYFERPTIQ